MFNDISPEGYSSPLLPTTPKSQTRQNDEQRSETLAQLPLLEQVVDRFDKRIAETDSVKVSLAYAEKYKVSRENILVAMDIVRHAFEQEKAYIEARVDRTK